MKKYFSKINPFAAAFLILLGTFITYLNRNFHLDDSLIYYRYIENFINGSGLVYNIGEYYNGVTSSLYIYISIALSSLTREVEYTQICFNGALIISSAILIYIIFTNTGKSATGLTASIIFISAKYFYYLFGLEIHLFIFISLLCIYFFFKKNVPALWISSAFLLLTRGEGLFLLIILFYFLHKENVKLILIPYIIIFALLLASNYLFNYWYYSSFFTSTLSAKIAQGKSGFWRDFSFILQFGYLYDMAFGGYKIYTGVFLFFFLIGVISGYKDKLVKIFLFYSLSIVIFYTALNVPNYHWYYAIPLFSFFLISACGINFIIGRIISAASLNLKLKIIIILLLMIYPLIIQSELFLQLKDEKPHREYKIIGEWLNDNTLPQTKVAAVEIGHLGWYSKRYIIDILGLVNPYNAGFIAKKEYNKWYDIYKPDYIVIHEPPLPHEKSISYLISNGYFVNENRISLIGFKLLKASSLK